jgi:cytoskeleton protein RodZ
MCNVEQRDWSSDVCSSDLGTALLIRSFIRTYCRSLGVDAEPLLEKYAAEIDACDQQDQGIRRYGKWSRGLRKKPRLGVFTVVLFGIVVVGIVYGGAWFWKFRLHSNSTQTLSPSGYPQQDLPADLSDKAGPSLGSEPPRENAAGVDKAARSAAVMRATDILPESSEKPPVARAEKHLFTVDASQKTWVQVTIDDKSTQNAMLEPGEKHEWESEKGMKIVVGNAGGIRMKWDGRPVEVPAKPGSVLRFSLPDQRYLKD